MRLLSIFFLMAVFTCSIVFASSPGTTGFQFLQTNVGARASAMGGAFVAVDNDVNSLYYNPAGIVSIKKRSGSFTYLNHLLDFNSGFIGLVQPKLGPGNFGISILYMDYGDFTKTDTNGQEVGDFGANSLALAASYAMEPYKNLYIGSSLKYIRASIDNYSADAMAIDAGFIFKIPSQQLAFAAGIYNLGQATSAYVEHKDDLPQVYRAGLSKELAHLPLMITAQVYKYKEEDWFGIIAGELLLSDNLLLRLGYDTAGRDMSTDLDSSKDGFAGTSIGLGILVQNFKIDYSYSSFGELGSLNRFSISSQF